MNLCIKEKYEGEKMVFPHLLFSSVKLSYFKPSSVEMKNVRERIFFLFSHLSLLTVKDLLVRSEMLKVVSMQRKEIGLTFFLEYVQLGLYTLYVLLDISF